MRKLLFPLLMVSIGLNLGLLYHQLTDRSPDRWSPRHRMAREAGRRGPSVDEPDAERGIRHRTRYLAEALGLSADQREEMSALLEQTVPRIMERKRAATDARRSLQETMAATPPDTEEFRRRVEKLNRAQAAVDSLVAEAMLAESSILTPDQRARYLELAPLGSRSRSRHSR